MIAHQGYAGFWRPGDIVEDKVLSKSQKTETLRHWRRAVSRLAPLASEEEREAYEKLTIELSRALTCIDNSPPTPHILQGKPLKTSQT